MNLYAITVAHCVPEVLGHGLQQFYSTCLMYPRKHIIVDNYWPLEKEKTSLALKRIAKPFNCELIAPPEGKNIGGHGGMTFAINHLNPKDDDLVVVFDPDSNPPSEPMGWLNAMFDVMTADPSFGYVSLMLDAIQNTRAWNYEMIKGVTVITHPVPEVFNVTMFRGIALREGMLADSTIYGFVETAMHRQITKLGLRSGFLYDYREKKCPIEHPEIYNRWKIAHAIQKYPGTFDEWITDTTSQLLYTGKL